MIFIFLKEDAPSGCNQINPVAVEFILQHNQYPANPYLTRVRRTSA
jgi:hypothetical protein